MNVTLRLTKLILDWCWIGWNFDLKFCGLGTSDPQKKNIYISLVRKA